MFHWMAAFTFFLSTTFALSINPTPTTIIRATEQSGLDRPEGLTFSPSGDLIAVANSLADTITFYKRIAAGVYETIPSFTLQGQESQLNYPHDLSFSRDGTILAVANRSGNSITLYRKNNLHFENRPFAMIQGRYSHISAPDAVRFSPTDNLLAVANMLSHTVTLYRYNHEQFFPMPIQVLRHPIFQIPDGIDFSKDGQWLAVTSHDAHAVALFKQTSRGNYDALPTQIIQGEETHFTYPHSLSFHPETNALAVSCSQGRQNVHLFIPEAGAFPNAPAFSMEVLEMYDASTIHMIEQLWQEGGVKGVAFSPDGKSIAVTQNLCQDMLKLPYPVGVLAIYAVK